MDFLDPKKQRRHSVLLYSGYILIGIAILISTVVLVYQANGFGVNSKGQVVQNGLVFFSSQPNPASIYLNGQLNKSQTNSRLSVPAGQYSVKLTRSGYRDWQRSIAVNGGDVQHFDYPFLFPKTLATKNLSGANYAAAPGIATQSRDQRWLIVQESPVSATFDIYDLKNPTAPATKLTIPASIVGDTSGTQTWQVVQWADDNQHVLLQHTSSTATQFIMVDRTDASKSINVNQTFGANPNSVTLIDNKYDQYYLFDSTSGELTSANLKATTPVKVLSGVIDYKSYGDNTILYITATGAPTNMVSANIFSGGKSYLIRNVAANTSYYLDMAGYSGVPYVVLSAASENEVYIYQDPVGQYGDSTLKLPAAIRAIKVTNPTYIGFSPNTQFVVAESGQQFGVYDIYQKRAYQYRASSQLDAPQTHATWMDGDRLTYISGGKQIVFDYDHTNVQHLAAANATYVPFFSPDYHYVYNLNTNAAGAATLAQTALLTPADL